jgi:hypothetical protein
MRWMFLYLGGGGVHADPQHVVVDAVLRHGKHLLISPAGDNERYAAWAQGRSECYRRRRQRLKPARRIRCWPSSPSADRIRIGRFGINFLCVRRLMVRSSIRRLPRAGRQKQKCLVVSRGRTRASAPVRAHSKWAGDELGLTFRFSILGPSMYLNIPFILNRSLWSDGSRSVHSMRPVLVQPGPITHVFIVSSCGGVRVRVPFRVQLCAPTGQSCPNEGEPTTMAEVGNGGGGATD